MFERLPNYSITAYILILLSLITIWLWLFLVEIEWCGMLYRRYAIDYSSQSILEEIDCKDNRLSYWALIIFLWIALFY